MPFKRSDKRSPVISLIKRERQILHRYYDCLFFTVDIHNIDGYNIINGDNNGVNIHTVGQAVRRAQGSTASVKIKVFTANRQFIKTENVIIESEQSVQIFIL